MAVSKNQDSKEEEYKEDFNEGPVSKESEEEDPKIKEEKEDGNDYKDIELDSKAKKNVSVREIEEDDQDNQNYDEEFDKISEGDEMETKNKNRKKSLKKNADIKEHKKNSNEIKEINEEEMLVIAQKCFVEIASKMKSLNTSFYKFFKKSINTIEEEGENIDVISQNDFLKGLEELHVKQFSENELSCLVTVLSLDENANYLKVLDIVQILEDYGIKDPEGDDKKKANLPYEINFDNVDKITLVLLLALTDYLLKAKVPLYSLLQSKIFSIKDTTTNKNIELIKSKDFFGILCEIGINLDDSEYQNLNEFLAFKPGDNQQLSIIKLKKAIEEIATNEELNNLARNCYLELLGDEENQSADEIMNPDLL